MDEEQSAGYDTLYVYHVLPSLQTNANESAQTNYTVIHARDRDNEQAQESLHVHHQSPRRSALNGNGHSFTRHNNTSATCMHGSTVDGYGGEGEQTHKAQGHAITVDNEEVN